MPAVFARLLQVYRAFLGGQHSYVPLRAVWRETGLELFDWVDHSTWGNLGWFEGSLFVGEDDAVEHDAERIVSLVDRVSHDNAMLDDVLKVL